ncbi:hypothetical protein CKM354_000936200 [Cercospora kikuchii]|uniref:Uncharacterized protein n=1 Tax=Cercospora kikuchii TaxID=84275 RepID=A0A9P3CXF1_9PEZI|nr:uncharacterized protein CKM354_000936200 [Cercospora kikuchii]GIZ46228.1 hypothetical protein CKM354_000936200 [Cercospora kikuchii]
MRAKSGNSFFEYPLSRPFPSPIFTWIIIVGGLVLTVLFSFVAVASNAYQLESVYTTNPNETESNSSKRWFQRQPFSWLNSMETKCQPALLTVGTRYLTTNRGFVYTLDSLRNGNYSAANYEVLSSTSYKNVTLRDCEVTEISINLARRDNSRQAKNFWSWGATNAQAAVSCSIESGEGVVDASFALELPPARDARRITDGFLTQNTTGNVNMWYGIQIAMSWYGQIATGMAYSVPGTSNTESWGAGVVTLTRNLEETDYKKMTFFDADVGISTDQGGLSFMNPGSDNTNKTMQDWLEQWTTGGGNYQLPNISTSIDAFGKTFYSLLLSDFGAGNDTNALLMAEGIDYLQSIVDSDLDAASDGQNKGTVAQRYDPNDQLASATRATGTTLFAQYLCSVPKSKGGWSIFFGVLLADIVFLSACWNLFVWISTTYVIPRLDSRMRYCEGCVNGGSVTGHVVHKPHAIGEMESQELLPVATPGSLSTRSAAPLIRNHSDLVC